MVYFVLSLFSVTIIFFIYLVKTKRWKHLGYFVGFVVIFTGIFIYALKVRPYTVRGPEDMFQEIILALCAAAGLFTNPVLQKIKGKNFPIQWPQLTKAASIAPSIFLLFWGAVEEMADITAITYCFAYANGYFWATVLKKELRFDLKEFDADIRERCLNLVVNADNPQDPKKVKTWDGATRTALTILEDRVRKLSGISDRDIHTKKLLKEAFGKNGPWKDRFDEDVDREDHIKLYTGVLGIFRNPYAHNLIDRTPEEAGSIVLFVDFLLKMLESLYEGKKENPPDPNLSLRE